jgi:hypothetical protein
LIDARNWGAFRSQFQEATGTALPAAFIRFADAMSTGIVLSRPTSNNKRAIELLRFERALSPLLILADDRKIVLVPIRDKLACELLPGVTVQDSLFQKEAMIRLERAYFGKSVNASMFERGTLVVFYISKKEGGRGEAVGVARVTSSGSGSPVQLSLSLLRQGVLGVDELEQLASRSREVSYFTFDCFTKFVRPISFEELDELGCVGAVKLVTSQALDFGKFLSILERSHGGGES